MNAAFPRTFFALNGLAAFVHDRCVSEGVDADAEQALQFAVEEIFTNMVKYGRGGEKTIAIAMVRDHATVRVVITDRGADPFDITRHPPADVTRPIEERTPGGLGLHLTRRMMDEVRYEYRESDRCTIITLVKRLETDHV